MRCTCCGGFLEFGACWVCERREKVDAEKERKKKAAAARRKARAKARREAMKSIGMECVRGPVSGRIYWE